MSYKVNKIEKDDANVATNVDTLNFEGNVSVVDNTGGKATITIGTDSILGRTTQDLFVGGSVDAWMFLSDSNSTPPSGPESLGAVSPTVFVFDVQTFGLSFSNKNNNVDVDAEFYKNGTLLFTWQIRGAQTATKTSGLSSLTFSAGDRLGIFLKDLGTGNNVDQATIELMHYINTDTLIDTNTPTI